jgi:hypothetical protein
VQRSPAASQFSSPLPAHIVIGYGYWNLHVENMYVYMYDMQGKLEPLHYATLRPSW